MKKIQGVGIIILFLFSMLAMPLILAEESQNDSEGMLIAGNDEQVPSALRFSWEKFKLNFVRNQTIKAERELQLARWKIAEANTAARKGNFDKAERAMDVQEQIMQRVQERISKMDNKSLTLGLDNAIQLHTERMMGLNITLENANLSEQQRTRIETQVSRMDNITQLLEKNREMIQERRQDRLDGLENKTDNIEERGEGVLERIEQRANGSGNSNN